MTMLIEGVVAEVVVTRSCGHTSTVRTAEAPSRRQAEREIERVSRTPCGACVWARRGHEPEMGPGNLRYTGRRIH